MFKDEVQKKISGMIRRMKSFDLVDLVLIDKHVYRFKPRDTILTINGYRRKTKKSKMKIDFSIHFRPFKVYLESIK